MNEDSIYFLLSLQIFQSSILVYQGVLACRLQWFMKAPTNHRIDFRVWVMMVFPENGGRCSGRVTCCGRLISSMLGPEPKSWGVSGFQRCQVKIDVISTRWAPARYKWSYNPYKWPYD